MCNHQQLVEGASYLYGRPGGEMNGCNLQAVTHTIIDHVRSLCSCCLDCLEDVHSSFNFDPLNFSHTSDEHTTAGHTITGGKGIYNTDTDVSDTNYYNK